MAHVCMHVTLFKVLPLYFIFALQGYAAPGGFGWGGGHTGGGPGGRDVCRRQVGFMIRVIV